MEYRVADTSLFAYLTKRSPHTDAYQQLIGDRRLAISFQTPAELLGAGYTGRRVQRLNDLLATVVILPHSEATDIWYSRVAPKRRELRSQGLLGRDAADADVWIISSALEHQVPLVSHDKGQVALGRAAVLKVYANLPDLRSANPKT